MEKVEKELDDGTKEVEEVKREVNTNEAAVIVIQVPQVEEEINIPVEVTGEKSPRMEKITKLVEENQDGKAIAVQNCLVENLKPDSYFVITEFAGKTYRNDFIDFIKKTYPDFFEDEEELLEELKKKAHAKAAADQDKFIKEKCNEYEFPCLDFKVSAQEL
jgi:hypothetical protein